MIRGLFALCLVLASGLAGWAVYLALRSEDQVPALVVDQPQRHLGEQLVGRHPLTIRLTNSTARPLRITLPAGSCGNNACLNSGQPEMVLTLSGRETADVSWELQVQQPGPFSTGIRLLAYGSQTEAVTVTVEGVGIACEDSAHDRPTP